MQRMLDFRERSRLRRLLFARSTLVVMFLATLFVAHAAWGMYEISGEALAKKEKAETELRDFEQREKELQADIARLSTPRGIEEEIRDRFMVAKEGEKVIIIAEPENKTHSVIVPDSEPTFDEKMKAAAGLAQ